MNDIKHLTMAEMEAGLESIRQSPKNNGRLEMIVRRPQIDAREVLETGELNQDEGLVGDNWKIRVASWTSSGPLLPDTQLNLMNVRVIALLAQNKNRWQLAGDQLFIDLDLSENNLPPGTKLSIGSAVIEITAEPHTGCNKFAARFGTDATKFVNSPEGKQLHLRGLNAKVMQAGTIRVGDIANKL